MKEQKTSIIDKEIDSYHILKEISKSEIGIVYKACHTTVNRMVRIKLIDPMLAQDERLIKKFKEEAQTQARLAHDNIVTLLDFRKSEYGWMIIVNYVDGPSLDEKMKPPGPLAIGESLDILKQLLYGLGYAHQRKVIHYDIKPENVILGNDGIVRLGDFGLYKPSEEHGGSTLVREYGTSSGGGRVIYYMSPEQMKGEQNIDHRTDIYSLGMTGYRMLCGQLPFPVGKDAWKIRNYIVNGTPPPLIQFNPALPLELSNFIMKAIAQHREERFQTTKEMLEALEKVEKNSQVANPRFVSGEKQAKGVWKKDSEKVSKKEVLPHNGWLQNIWLWILLAVVVVLVFVLIWKRSGSSIEEISTPNNGYSSGMAKLVLSSKPKGAIVYIEGDSIGSTPIESHLRPGKVSLEIAKKNYKRIDTILMLNVGHPPINVVLEPLPKTKKLFGKLGGLYVESKPSGALVYLGGKYLGIAPLQKEELKPGKYQLKLTYKGYKEHVRWININRGTIVQLPIKLTGFGYLEIRSSPQDAEIFIDGNYYGKTPLLKQKLVAGEHDVLLQKDGYKIDSTHIKLTVGKLFPISKTLVQQQRNLEILVKPWGTVSIDGQVRARNTNRQVNIELSTGVHRVTIEHPSMGKWEKNIRIYPNRSKKIMVDFHKKVKLTIASAPVWGEVFIDGVSRGSTAKEVLLSVGQHTIEVRRSGYRTIGGRKKFNLEKDLTEPLIFTLEKI